MPVYSGSIEFRQNERSLQKIRNRAAEDLAHNGEFREKRLELEACLREWEEKTGDFENSRIVREEKV
ncbi:hypothetical protein [Hungatella hathewayi]|uniref:hypothetical protein n=1 Tax=Hungatella hathewayi TaxID=154046 RepID=UPI0026E279D5|nr:hypothetical protein [Hungatella hathewayi]